MEIIHSMQDTFNGQFARTTDDQYLHAGDQDVNVSLWETPDGEVYSMASLDVPGINCVAGTDEKGVNNRLSLNVHHAVAVEVADRTTDKSGVAAEITVTMSDGRKAMIFVFPSTSESNPFRGSSIVSEYQE